MTQPRRHGSRSAAGCISAALALATAALAAPALAAEVCPEPAQPVTCEAGDDLAAAPGLALLGPGMRGTSGGSGLFGMATAQSGPAWHLGAALHLFGYSQGNFLLTGDRHTSVAGALQIDVTLGRFVELWLALGGSASRSERDDTARLDPLTQRTLGDLRLGVKLHGEVTRGFHLGVQPVLAFTGGPDTLGPTAGSASIGADALATLDLRALTRRVPLRLHLSGGYFQDRSESALPDCPSPERTQDCAFARIVNTTTVGARPPRGQIAVGVDLALRLGSALILRPLAAYHAEIHVGDGDAAIQQALLPRGAATVDRVNGRVLQWVEAGLRLQTAARLTVDLGLLGSLSPVGFAYGAQTAQVAGYGALAFATDLGASSAARRPRPRPPEPVPTTLPATLPPPRPLVPVSPAEERAGEGRVRGVVRDARSGAPLPGAQLRFPGRQRNAVVVDERGEFEAGPFTAGPLWLEVSRPDFERRRVEVLVRVGQITQAELTLSPRPATPTALRVDVIDDRGVALPALVVVTRDREGPDSPQRSGGPSPDSPQRSGGPSFELPPDIGGGFQREVAPGRWRLRVDSDGYLSRELPLDLVSGQPHRVAMTLRRRPPSPTVRLADGSLVLKSSVSFEPATAILSAQSAAILDEIVDLLVWHPEIVRLSIEGHTDSTGTTAANQQLSEERALTVRNYLIKQGLAPERLTAMGYGAAQPLVPETSPAARARNRRVAFKILERAAVR